MKNRLGATLDNEKVCFYVCYYISKYKLFTRLSYDAVTALNTTLIMQYRPTVNARKVHIIVFFIYKYGYD